MSHQEKYGVIGGSGVYELLEHPKITSVNTPFGEIRVAQGEVHGKIVFFLPRHGSKHSIPPHQINYRGNIYALHKLGVQGVLATNAVGSTRKYIKPGDFVIPDQVMDFTKQRVSTFFTGDFQTEVKGKLKKGVIHTDMTEPFDNHLREQLWKVSEAHGVTVHYGGTIAVSEGPRFETPAEVNAFRLLGGDILGMTTAPEVFLAKELEIPFATLAIVTNFGAGMQSKVTHEEVIEIFQQRTQLVRSIIKEVIDRL